MFLRDQESRIPKVVLALACVLLLTLAACDGNGGDGSGGEDAAATQEGGDAGSEGGDDTGETTEDGDGSSGESGDSGDGGGDARFNLIASPDNAECTYIPNGHLSGADQLSVHFFFLIIGGNPPDVPAVSVTGSSDTGLSTSYSAGPHNQAVSSAQFALRPGDFGRSHTLTITVDASNQVPETDESDNRIRVSASLPSPRPSQTIDPLPCSVSQG